MGARPVHVVHTLSPRADLFKCPGRELSACAICSRKLAPDAGSGQRWITRLSIGDACVDYANVETYGQLYAHDSCALAKHTHPQIVDDVPAHDPHAPT